MYLLDSMLLAKEILLNRNMEVVDFFLETHAYMRQQQQQQRKSQKLQNVKWVNKITMETCFKTILKPKSLH